HHRPLPARPGREDVQEQTVFAVALRSQFGAILRPTEIIADHRTEEDVAGPLHASRSGFGRFANSSPFRGFRWGEKPPRAFRGATIWHAPDDADAAHRCFEDFAISCFTG